MSKKLKVLFAGEAIFVLTSIYKGRDTINIGKYAEHGGFFLGAMKDNDIDCDYIPTNKVMEEFPWTLEELKQYDAIAVSDVGSDTFLVSERTMNGEKTPNRLKLIEQYVKEGGSYLMWGGYISFTGLYGKGFYKNTPIEKILPVELMQTDDRVEGQGSDDEGEEREFYVDGEDENHESEEGDALLDYISEAFRHCGLDVDDVTYDAGDQFPCGSGGKKGQGHSKEPMVEEDPKILNG